MITTGEGGGGGSTSNVCFSLADAAAYIGNLEQRVAVLEMVLSQLLGTNIGALQLSDISTDGGLLTSLKLAGGPLGQLMQAIGRMNVFAYSLEDPWITTGSISSQNNGLFTDPLHNAQYLQTGTSTGSMAGFQAQGQGLRYNAQYFHGGFYFKARVSLGEDGITPTTSPDPEATYARVFIGLHSAVFVGPNSIYNNDDPGTPSGDIFASTSFSSLYIAFHLSPSPATRGDTTWKIIVRDEPTYVLYHTYVPRVIDTGVAPEFNTYYDYEMRCEPGSGVVTWKITRCLGGVAASGAFAIPDVYDSDGSPVSGTGHTAVAYNAGVGVWKLDSDPAQWKTIYVHDFWSQSLDMDTP